ncbi:hypothetical protein [Pseudoalteromonas rhizosphaerae]|uniref:hypothetical protein n=1 Tax=Pseudoalteromonas rhizosphaerae TaxID=2518973 RepID=UPI003850F51E
MDEWTIRVAIACVFTLLGWIIGHRLALGREKRKEYNDAIEPIRYSLINEQEVTKSEVLKFESIIGNDAKTVVSFFNGTYSPEFEKINEMKGFWTNNNEYVEDDKKEEKIEKLNQEFLKVCKIK